MDETWWASRVPALAPYAVLLGQLVEGRMSPEEFEVVFLPLYKHDATVWPPKIFEALDCFFGDVDDFCADPALRAVVGGIDESELRARAVKTLAWLAELAS